jgi:hypothetical protein
MTKDEVKKANDLTKSTSLTYKKDRTPENYQAHVNAVDEALRIKSEWAASPDFNKSFLNDVKTLKALGALK